jgi:ATP-dependent Clp protease ATP-binding subunit ClpA
LGCEVIAITFAWHTQATNTARSTDSARAAPAQVPNSACATPTKANAAIGVSTEAMKLRHSESLVLIWRVSEFEARQLKASVIEPTHLLLGLCKAVDLELTALVSKDKPDRDEILEELLREVRRLKEVFRAANLDARTFRRRLRRLNGGNRFSPSEAERLRRSPAAKRVFADAEHFAAMADCAVLPVHLLYSVLLAEDEKRDQLLVELRVDLKRLQQVAKREILFQRERGTAQADRRTNLN